MCDPITIGMAALGGAAALLGNKDAPTPPPAAIITPPSPVRNPNAVVKASDGAQAQELSAAPDYTGFTEKRVTGKPLGGLGRGGLGL